MKASEIRELNSEERDRKLRDLKEALFNLRFQNAVGQIENNRKLVSIKRDIARINTVINEIATINA